MTAATSSAAGGASGGSRGARWARNEALQAALVLLLEIAAFLWIPLSRYPDVYYSASDLTQTFSLTRVEPGHRPGNQLQSDFVTQMRPWTMFNREELAEGRLPLWNPWNGAGCPHFANYQSAVFSPFQVPFYVLPAKPALLLSAALKLFALGFFTYLFLRRIGLAHAPAVLGLTLFTFAGHNTLLLYFPHVGAMSALPAALFCVESAFQRVLRAREERRPARLRAPLAGLTIVLLVGLLAGNPEPFYFSCGLVFLYVMARLFGLWRSARDTRERLETAQLLCKIAFASALAAGLAAFQILPFFEYLDESRVIEQRSMRQTPLEKIWWPLAMFPDVLGTPSSPYKISDEVPPPNYELVVAAYTGAAALLMAFLAPLFARRSGFAWFFALTGLSWVFYAYDVAGAADWFMRIPTVDMAPMNRSQGVWNFIVACSAAIGLDAALKAEGRRGLWHVLILFVLGLGTWIACLVGADRLIEKYSTFPSPNHVVFLEHVPEHIRSASTYFAGMLVLLAIVWLSRRRTIRTVAAAGLIVFAFLSTGWMFHTYNPVTENRFSFPVTPAIETLRSKVGRERLAILGEDMIPPASNLAYGIQTISNYDAMWVRDFDLLFRDHFGDGNNWRPILKGSRRSLRIFGVQYVLAKWGWNWIDSGLQGFGKNTSLAPIRREILPGQEVEQTFHSRLPGLSTVMVQLSTFQKHTPCELRFTLEEVSTGRVVVSRTLTSEEIQGSVYSKRHTVWPREFRLEPAGRPVVIRFEPLPDSAQRDYRIRLASPAGKPGDTVCAWSMPVNSYHEGESRQGGRRLEGEILFDWSYLSDREFEPVAEFEDYVLYRFRQARPRFSLVRGAVEGESDEQVLARLRNPYFDPGLLVVLGPDGDARTGAAPLPHAARKRVVKFADHPFVYMVGPDGKQLAHIDDEATFIANGFDWASIETLPATAREGFRILDDTDRDAKRALGMVFIEDAEREAQHRASVDANRPRVDPVTVLHDEPTEIRLRVDNVAEGHLVFDHANFPGWHVEVDGVPTPIRRANYAFAAIELAPGQHEVRLWYWPDSLRMGRWISLACLVAGVASLSPFRPRRA